MHIMGSDECGQGLVEYGVILVLVAVLLILLVVLLGNGINSMYSNIVTEVVPAL
jgi:pilus assembly protein Flp/PilA